MNFIYLRSRALSSKLYTKIAISHLYRSIKAFVIARIINKFSVTFARILYT